MPLKRRIGWVMIASMTALMRYTPGMYKVYGKPGRAEPEN